LWSDLHVNKAVTANQITARDSHLSFMAENKAMKNLGLIPRPLDFRRCQTAADNLSQRRLSCFSPSLIIRVAWTSLPLEAIMAIREDLVASAVSLSENSTNLC
jgi:hypothetical protein